MFEVSFALYFMSMALYLIDFLGDTVKCSRFNALAGLAMFIGLFITCIIIVFSETGVGIILREIYGETDHCP